MSNLIVTVRTFNYIINLIVILLTIKLINGRFLLKANLEDICHKYYANDFVFAAEVFPEDCLISCYLLNNDNHNGHIFDAVDVKNHTLGDGTPCKTLHKCVNGTCTRFYNNGTLYIVINGVELNDTYTQVTYGGHIEVRIYLNGLLVVNKSTTDKKELLVADVNRESKVKFEVANSIKKREVIAFTEVIVKDIISKNNGTDSVLMTSPSDNTVILNFTINWFENQANTV